MPKVKETKVIHYEPRETVIVVYDFHNINGGCRSLNKELDLCALRDYLSADRKVIEHIVYIGINPFDLEASKEQILALKEAGFLVKSKLAKVLPGERLKCNFDSQIIVDAINITNETKPDIVVLVSGDGDFLPLIEWLRHHGIRTEVASVDGIISEELKRSANGYIDLTGVISNKNIEGGSNHDNGDY